MRFSFLGFRLFLFLFVEALGHFVLLLSRQPRIALIGVSPFSLGRRKDIGVRSPMSFDNFAFAATFARILNSSLTLSRRWVCPRRWRLTLALAFTERLTLSGTLGPRRTSPSVPALPLLNAGPISIVRVLRILPDAVLIPIALHRGLLPALIALPVPALIARHTPILLAVPRKTTCRWKWRSCSFPFFPLLGGPRGLIRIRIVPTGIRRRPMA